MRRLSTAKRYSEKQLARIQRQNAERAAKAYAAAEEKQRIREERKAQREAENLRARDDISQYLMNYKSDNRWDKYKAELALKMLMASNKKLNAGNVSQVMASLETFVEESGEGLVTKGGAMSNNFQTLCRALGFTPKMQIMADGSTNVKLSYYGTDRTDLLTLGSI